MDAIGELRWVCLVCAEEVFEDERVGLIITRNNLGQHWAAHEDCLEELLSPPMEAVEQALQEDEGLVAYLDMTQVETVDSLESNVVYEAYSNGEAGIVADFDQLKAAASEALREATAFVMVSTSPEQISIESDTDIEAELNVHAGCLGLPGALFVDQVARVVEQMRLRVRGRLEEEDPE